MKTICASLASTILILLLWAKAFGQEQISAPAYMNGDLWHFSVKEANFTGSTTRALDGVYEAFYRGGKFRFSKLGAGEVEESESTEGSSVSILRAMFGQGTYYGGQHLKFPLFVSQKWDFEYSITARGARNKSTQHAYVQIAGIEEVTTAAGTFRTLKVLRENTSKSGGSIFVFNYCPDTKSVVKASFDFNQGGKREIELIKFGREK